MKALIKLLSILGIGVLVNFSLLSYNNYNEVKLSYEDIIKIEPVSHMSRYTLHDRVEAEYFHNEVLNELINKGVIALHPAFGLVSNPKKVPYSVNLIIDSSGGRVAYAFILKRLFKNLKSVGIKFKCYVANAQSSAFYFMVTTCDYVTLKKGGVLMQHRSYSIGKEGKEYSIHSQTTDLKMAKDEAQALNIEWVKWLKITRGSTRDKVFTEEEYKKYGLVDEIIP